jgi:competence protein ComEC
MGGRCAVAVAVVVWCGLALGRGFGAIPSVACLSVALPIAWLAGRAPARVGTVLVLMALALAGMARGGASRLVLEHGASALGADPEPRWIRARVLEHPLREGGEPLAIARLIEPGASLVAGTRVRLRLPAGCEAEWGDTVTAFAVLERPPARSNPGGFSSRDAAAGVGIAVHGRVLAARVAASTGMRAWARATAVRWRRAVEGVLARGLTPESRQLVTPLVVGDRSALPPAVGADLRASGLTHLLALSGLHVVWLAGIARGVAAAMGSGVRGRALAGAACALFYALVAGPLPSLMRAVMTEWMSTLARLVGRSLDPIQSLALSALTLLIVAPSWAGDLGFQLSCGATLGLVTAGPWITSRAGALKAWIAPFVPTLAAQLMALPLLIERFHALPLTSLASNLVAVPVCGALLASAWLGVALECALPGAGAPFLAACEPLAEALRWIAGTAGRMPGALMATGSEPGIAVLGVIGAILLALGLPEPRDLAARARPTSRARHDAMALGALASLLALALAVSAPALRPAPGRWWLVMLDVGQGEALALGFRDGWWLVDAGPRTPRFDAGESTVLPFLRWAGVRRLEQLVLTHDDGDHTGGAHAVLRGTEVGAIVTPIPLPGVPGPGPRFETAGVPVLRHARGDTLRGAPRVIVRWPPAGMPLMSDNAASLVLEVAGEGGAVLLAADIDSTREDQLTMTAPLVVLKVAHHGSGSSSGADFLGRARPALTAISCGRRNAFGHPHDGALARLAAAGASIVRTDHEGAIWLEFSSRGMRRVSWREDEPRGGSRPGDPDAASAAARSSEFARLEPRW